ncbi:MAG: hypothetical protein JWN73_1282 [Betaproteobacteria bacterium]|nr:hypothetical protein [Betaproteobacteria bacterium]
MLGRIIKGVFRSANEPPPPEAPALVRAMPSPHEHASRYAGNTFISFSTSSRSDGLNSGVNALAQMCRAQGYRFENIDLREDGWSERIFELVRKPEEIICTVGLAGMLDSMQVQAPEGARNLWTEAGIPFLSFFGDHPAYFISRHQFRSHGHLSLYCFTEHMEAVRAWINPQPTIGQLTQAHWDAVGPEQIDFSAKASGKVCFFKNGNNPAALRDFWRTLPTPVSRWLEELSHSFDVLKLGREGKPLHLLVRDYLVSKGIYMDTRPWVEVFLVAQLDDYARRMKSTLVAEALLDLPVNIFGDFWDHVDFTGRRAVHLPGRSYFDTRQLISDSLCVLDMSPNTQSAPHERFLSAIGRHTLCLTNTQKYYEDNYARAGEMMFDFDAESIRERVAGVLARPAQAVELGAEIAAQGRARHTGAAALESLIEYAKLARFGMSPAQFPGQQDFVAWPR